MSSISIRSTDFSRWSRLAVAGLLLASSAFVYAQTNEEKGKKAPAAAHKTEAAPTQTTVHPPATTKGGEVAPVHPPATFKGGEAPVHPPATFKGGEAPVHPPATFKGGEAPVRQPGTVNGNQNPVRQPGGVTPVNGGRIQNAVPPGGRAGGNGLRNSRPADFHGANNTQVHYGSNGQPQVVHAKGMTIVHTPAGTRRVVVERPDHSVIVTNGARNGYIQRPYTVHNVTYVQRNYYVGGVSYSRVYRPYAYGGISLNVYMPGRYYAPGFYAWAYNPWARPVVYNWGWAGSPWVGFYGGWFTPYPTYTNATFWLTDYMLSMTLQQAYQDRMAAQAADNEIGRAHV